jgi:plastocyanin
MTQKQILAALAVVVLVVIGLVLFSNRNNQVANTNDNINAVDTVDNTNNNTDAINANTNSTNANANTQTTVEPTAPDGNDVQVFEISYNGTAYTPSTQTVKAGDTIIFKNDSDKSFWPASGPHPSHTLYPEFDPKKAIPAGGTWSFKFTKVGVWPFHDHLNPTAFGKITVQ